MKVLFTSPILEHPAAGGPELRIENSIKALARECELDVVYRRREGHPLEAATADFFGALAREFHAPAFPRFAAAREAAYLLRHLDRQGAQVLWCGYGNLSWGVIRALRKARPGLRLVCDTDSVWSRFVLRELPYARGPRALRVRLEGWWAGREERACVNLCDATTAVSDVDADYYRGIARHPERVHRFSNVIDLASYAAPPSAPAGLRHPAVYLAGTFGHVHSPMDTAAQWMLEEVMPRVWRELPAAHFYLVGKRSDERFGHLRDPRVTATGKLPSVLPYLCHADVAVVPLKYESGTRFKILEAGACGIPLVSTVLGAEGLPVRDGEHLLLADDAEGFAAAILRILRDRDLATRLAGNCRSLVAAQFSIDALRAEARAILGALA